MQAELPVRERDWLIGGRDFEVLHISIKDICLELMWVVSRLCKVSRETASRVRIKNIWF